MELEEAINKVCNKLPIFPMALSVVEEKFREEAEQEIKIILEQQQKKSFFKPKPKPVKAKTEITPEKEEKSLQNKLKAKGETAETEIQVKEKQDSEEAFNSHGNNYSVNYELLRQNIYGVKSIQPSPNYSEITAVKSPWLSPVNEENYMTTTQPESDAEILEAPEAERKMLEMQYAFLLSSSTQISQEEKRKMNWWIMLEPALFKLYEANALTRDVNYRGY